MFGTASLASQYQPPDLAGTTHRLSGRDPYAFVAANLRARPPKECRVRTAETGSRLSVAPS